MLTGNSSSLLDGAADGVPAVFMRHPFNHAPGSARAVAIGAGTSTPGRGAGGARFLLDR